MVNTVYASNKWESVCLLAFHIPEEISRNQKALINEVSKSFTKVFCIHSNNKIPKGVDGLDAEFVYSPIDNNYLDFGKYYYFITKYIDTLLNVKRLLLMNDSCYIVKSLQGILESKQDEIDIYGITNSYEIHPHIQSYFLLCESSKSIDSVITFFKTFDFTILPNNFTKSDIVRAWEIGISIYLLEECKHKYNCLIEVKETYPCNISYLHPDVLYASNVPLIKIKNIKGWVPNNADTTTP